MDAKAWEKVDELIDKNQNKTIKDYFAEDPDRAQSIVHSDHSPDG